MRLNPLADASYQIGIATVAIAVVATAVVQLIKDLFPARRWFQQRYLQRWFSTRWLQRKESTAVELDLRKAERDLVRLATGGDRKAFYDLETAQLCGQMNTAAQLALTYASRHRDLLYYLAPEADPKDIEMVTTAPSTSGATPETVDVNTLLDARNRLAHHLQRGVDALQISMSFRWKFILQLLAYSVSFVVSFAAVFAVNADGRFNIIESILMGIVAGFISPAISDFVATINRLRRS